MWCCSEGDGNSWPGDTYFSTSNWLRGLTYMANHVSPGRVCRDLLKRFAKAQSKAVADQSQGKAWPNLMSMSLRNELRNPTSNKTLASATYDWQHWYTYAKQGVSAIHTAHADVLVFLSGLSYDTYMTPITQGTALTPGNARFAAADFGPGVANKLVIELHNYANSATSCASLQSDLLKNGFDALDAGSKNPFPVMMTEFGFQMDASTWKGVYASCLQSFLPARKAGWMIWVLAGSYYIRSGKQDYDESWGLLNHDWSDWRSPSYINGGFIPMIKATLS